MLAADVRPERAARVPDFAAGFVDDVDFDAGFVTAFFAEAVGVFAEAVAFFAEAVGGFAEAVAFFAAARRPCAVPARAAW